MTHIYRLSTIAIGNKSVGKFLFIIFQSIDLRHKLKTQLLCVGKQ